MSDAILAGALAGAAALSLPLGAAVAVTLRPPAWLVAIVMAFGSGALIHAVVTELAVHPADAMVREHGYAAFVTWLVLAAGFLLGGLAYIGINAVVERGGGGLHRRVRIRRKALDEKREQVAPVMNALARSELAHCLSPHEAQELLPYLRRVELATGDVLYRHGDVADALYIVEAGQLARAPAASGATATADLPAGPGHVIGGLSMLARQPRAETVSAVGPSVLLRLSRDDLDHVLAKLPRLRAVLAGLVGDQLFESARSGGAVDPEEWRRTAVGSISHLTHAEAEAATAKSGEGGSPLAIFIGALQDGVPESIAIGAGFAGLAAFSPTFLVAVFLSNFPEAVGGTTALLRSGFRVRRVLLMWSSLVVASALAGWLGYVLLNGAPAPATAFLGALAGGGVVAMLATTMMPEAYEAGHAGVAPATIVGFLASLLLAVFEISAH